jgi:hypothetical protein
MYQMLLKKQKFNAYLVAEKFKTILNMPQRIIIKVCMKEKVFQL